MAKEGRKQAVLETSVLVNFLVVDRVDLLENHPDYRFVLTDHVKDEITSHYPEQVERLQAGLDKAVFDTTAVDSLSPNFAALTKEKRYGNGECAALAYAIDNELPIAIDDKKAANAGKRLNPNLRIETTETLIVSLLKKKVLTVGEADELKTLWESKHRFKLPFGSFKEKLGKKAK
jgi:predicted nucleic acid-binding protein